jgi:polyisoprenoid-binding protein YceI
LLKQLFDAEAKEKPDMSQRIRKLALAALAAIALSTSAHAAGTWVIDPAHSGVTFKVKHLVSIVPGRFTTFSGEFQFDEGAIESSSVSVTIDANSITTDNEKRDGHLKSPDFFDTATYPTITYKSTKVKKIDATRFEVTGDLTMRGVTKPVILSVEYLGTSPGMGYGPRSGFHATASLNRQDFGVKWNKTLDSGGLLVSDNVDIDLTIEAGPKQ